MVVLALGRDRGFVSAAAPWSIGRRSIIAAGVQSLAGVASGAWSRDVTWTAIATPDHRTVLCDVRLEGRRARAMIDSGAGRSALSTRLAARLALPLGEEHEELGVTGAARGRTTPSLRMAIAGRTVSLERPTVYDLSPIAFALRQPVDIVLGADLFDRFGVRLDFLRNRLSLSDPGAPSPSEGFARLPLRRDRQGRIITVVHMGEEALEAQVDLGSDVAAYLSPAFVQKRDLLRGKRTSQAVSIGIEGAGLDTVFTLPRLVLGETSLGSIPVRTPRAWSSDAPLLIGMPVLRRFDLDFRLADLALWLRAEPTLVATPFRRDRSGLGAGWTGETLQVGFVAPASPASTAGLRAGDVITAIDGRRVNAALLAGGVRFGAGAAGTRLKLDLADGRRVLLTLADYY